ncbi:ELWxxDGT repeat protein [Fischerella thermalis]|uniref:ELWxxDGT repeat protein n=1 Tax=Fischerella thermalis TaxID=372787 RepID=UPI000C800309|nr:ELWxxDGT repeat protein [Fischerella thermalis]PLZ13669.1 peptidase [Fischerella thermalis WC119]PLZ14058.1 peptidase [Fischerella thermalis WC1110]PLZ28882.1 peptidase [Fischerella thermalis WC341]PLZ36475.1 peptidase [Fischerella thermalis WC538]PLZ41425.1 peptidase [Fischerella thermalis WC527]
MATFSGFPDPGSTRSTALDTTSASYIGGSVSSTPNIFQDSVSSSDISDYYKISIGGSSASLLSMTLDGLSDNASLNLYTQTGTLLQTANFSGTASELLTRTLSPGIYYVRVGLVNGAVGTNYNLSLAAYSIQESGISDNTRATAQNIGTLSISSPTTYINFVGSKGVITDSNDYYKFNIATDGKLNLSLQDLVGNANVELYNNSGTRIAFSNNPYTTSESIIKDLTSGTYYIRVYDNTGATNYTLNLSFESKKGKRLDIWSGPNSSNPDSLTALGSTLYFTANDGSSGVQLWKSDGSVAGTSRITNFNPSGFNPANLTAFGTTKLFFTADDGSTGRELWVYDSSTNTTTRLSDINPSAGNANPQNLTVVGNRLFFTADNGSNGRELWVSDGNTVSLVKDIYTGATSSNPSSLLAFGGKLYFAANDGVNGTELWSSDGTAAGTTLVKDVAIGGASSVPANLTVVGSTLYFTANDGSTGIELWKSDGTAGGTSVIDLTPGTGGFGPTLLTAVGSTLYFVLDSNNDFKQELWKSDGTNTARVKSDLNAAPNLSFGPINLTAVGSMLYFTTYDPNNGFELWRSDGSDAGTYLVKDIWSGSDSSLPGSLVNFGGTLYFAASTFNASEEQTSREVWSSDGTEAGTQQVTYINSVDYANPDKLTVVGDKLFFIADDGINGTELWVL